MSEIPDSRIILAIDLKKNRLRVHRTALKQLGSPAYVQLLVSPRDNAIIIMGCEKHLPGGQEIKVVFDKPGPAGTFDIYSKELISRLKKQFSGQYTVARICPFCDCKVEILYRGSHGPSSIKCPNCGEEVLFPPVSFRRSRITA